jgi:hypothetical protein
MTGRTFKSTLLAQSGHMARAEQMELLGKTDPKEKRAHDKPIKKGPLRL